MPAPAPGGGAGIPGGTLPAADREDRMKNPGSAIWAEFLKARHSGTAWTIALAFGIAPAIGGLFMLILKDPEAWRSVGLISAKANLTAGEATWPAYFGMLAQMESVGGLFVFGILTAWVFGREF